MNETAAETNPLPKEAGIYWARENWRSQFHMLVMVSGVAPFLEVSAWSLIPGEPFNGTIGDLVWGPKVEIWVDPSRQEQFDQSQREQAELEAIRTAIKEVESRSNQ